MKNYGPKATLMNVVTAHAINGAGLLALYIMYNPTGLGALDWIASAVAIILIGLTLLASVLLNIRTFVIVMAKNALETQRPIVSFGQWSNFAWDLAYLAMMIAHSSWVIGVLYIGHIIAYNNFRKKLPVYIDAIIAVEEKRMAEESAK